MLWGVALKQGDGKSFAVVDPIHISGVALERDRNLKVGHVEVWTRKEEDSMIAVLNKRTLNVPLNLILSKGEKISFYIKGNGTVHLSGFFLSLYDPKNVIPQKQQDTGDSQTDSVTNNTETELQLQRIQTKADLIIENTHEGDGIAVKNGDSVEIFYRSYLADTEQFINVHLTGDPFKLKLGQRKAVIGLENGIVGMKVGSKRKITCPPEMAFGKVGIPSLVPPNATIIYEVELMKIDNEESVCQ